MTIRQHGQESHVDSTYALRAYNLQQWTRLVDRSALAIDAVVGSDGANATAHEPGYFVFILRPRDHAA